MGELSHEDWIGKAAAIRFRDRAVIDGRAVAARSGRTFASINPATDEALADVASCGEEDVDLAVAAARRSFESGIWSRAAPAQRKAVLLRLAQLLRDNLHEMALLESLDAGRLVKDAADLDVPRAAAIFQWCGESLDTFEDGSAPAAEGGAATVLREPLGVIGAIVSSISPLASATWKCAPALAAGNSVVLKPAEQSSLSALRLAELALEAGLPAGVFNVVPGLGETAGQALGRHMDVDCLAFAGSMAVGKLFLQYSGQSNMKRVWPEAIGRSLILVFADCGDLDAAADMAALGASFGRREVGAASSRLLVQRGIKDALIEKLVSRARATRPGDPLDPASKMGAMASADHATDVMRIIETGRRSARLIAGGDQVSVDGRGSFIAPTIFDEVAPHGPLVREEIVGPVLSVTAFEDEEQAIRIANASQNVLAASLWIGSLPRASRIAARLRAGRISVNASDALIPAMPIGGSEQLGSGGGLSLRALDQYSALKTVRIKY